MEYIEPKPVEEKPHAKRNKIIIGSTIAALSLAAIGVGYYFLIDRIFMDFENIEIYDYSYKYDENKNVIGTIINTLKDDAEIPAHLRIPRKLGGYPVIELAAGSCEYFPTLESVDFPDTIKTIGAEAFKECINLSSFNAPRDLEEIGTDAFIDTKWFDDQEDGEVMIGKFLYAYKGDMEEDTILVGSESSSLLDEYPDADVIDLSKYTHMSNGVFKGKSRVRAVEYPTSLTKVNNDTFADCLNLEKVILPANVTSIGNNAFSTCSLTALPDLTHIYSIGDSAFAFNKIAGEITIPESVHSIGSSVFRKNKQLTKVTVTDSLDTIPSSAFLDCENLAEFVFPESEFVPGTSHIKSIGASAFENTKIATFDVPYNVNTIMNRAFAKCSLLTSVSLYNNTSASKFINRTVNSEGVYGDWRVNDDTIQGITLFGDSVFEEDTSLMEVRLTNSDGTKTNANTVSIPVTVVSFGSQSIGGGSKIFYNTAITEINFAQNPTASVVPFFRGLTYIAPSLCENCHSLTKIIIPENSLITSIRSAAFKNCTSLTDVTIPASISSIADAVFEGCGNLGSGLVFASGFNTTSFKAYSFKGTAIASVTAPVSLADIETSAFEGCTFLTSFDLTHTTGLATIGDSAFKGCSSLSSLQLHQSITRIGASAFEGCSSLTSLFLSVNIANLPNAVFKGCSSLDTLVLTAPSVVTIGNEALDGCTSLTKIKVPNELVDDYNAAPQWQGHGYTFEPIPAE